MKDSERTEVFYGTNNVINTVIRFLDNTIKKIDACVDHTRPSLAIGIVQLRGSFLDAKKRGVKLRYVTEITDDNISYCKELMTMVDELRHLDGIHGNFYTSEKEYLAPATMHEKGKPASQIIYSNVKEIVEHQQYVFDSFWNRAIPAEQKIREIEEGVMPDVIEVIRNPSEVQELYLTLVKDAKEEVMVILSTTNAFIRQEKIGIIRILEQVAEEHNVKVRILMPADRLTEQMVKILRGEGEEEQPLQKPQQQQSQSQHTSFRNNNYSNIEIRYIEQTSSTKSTFLVIDRKISLVMELKDDSRETFTEAVGLSIYSTSKPGVLSYVSIFENLWIQTEMYQQIKETNEQLKIHDKMQKEFINIASHEMKTPTQAILGYTDLLQHYPERRDEFIEAIYRNATRLQRLTDDILDVTRIESQSLKLNKEHLDLHKIISDFVDDYRIEINKRNSNVKLLYKPNSSEPPIFVNADKGRIIQVLSNLLSNSIKFTDKGSISINATTISHKKNDQDREEAMITIKDTGSGIDPEILPRLFTKFATKSHSGTGLGLYISKSIIEAHGGRIWATNNMDGKGATLTFTLPLNEDNQNINTCKGIMNG